MQPTAQLTRAHRGRCLIEHGCDSAFRPIGEAHIELEIAACRSIEQHRIASRFGAQPAQMRQRRLLRIAHVLQQTAGRANRKRQAGAPEAGEIARRELLAEQARAALFIEVPDRALAKKRADLRFRLLRHQYLCRLEPLDLARERFFPARFEHAEATARELEPREPESIAVQVQACEQRVAARFQEGIIGHGPGCDHADDLPLDRSFRLRRIADLLADCDGFAAADEAGDVTFCAVIRDAGHRDGLPRRLPARSQRDVEQTRGPLRIVVEQFIEVAHSVEQQRVRMLRLHAQVLLHHRGVGFERGGHS